MRKRELILSLLLCRNNEIIVRGCVKFSKWVNFMEEFDRFESERFWCRQTKIRHQMYRLMKNSVLHSVNVCKNYLLKVFKIFIKPNFGTLCNKCKINHTKISNEIFENYNNYSMHFKILPIIMKLKQKLHHIYRFETSSIFNSTTCPQYLFLFLFSCTSQSQFPSNSQTFTPHRPSVHSFFT